MRRATTLPGNLRSYSLLAAKFHCAWFAPHARWATTTTTLRSPLRWPRFCRLIAAVAGDEHAAPMWSLLIAQRRRRRTDALGTSGGKWRSAGPPGPCKFADVILNLMDVPIASKSLVPVLLWTFTLQWLELLLVHGSWYVLVTVMGVLLVSGNVVIFYLPDYLTYIKLRL